MPNPRRLIVRLTGPRVTSGRISVDDLVRVSQGLQLAVKRTGLREAGRPGKGPGRLPKEIEAACSLDLTGFSTASVKLVLALRESSEQLSLLNDVGELALAGLLSDISRFADNLTPMKLDFGIVEPLLDVSGLLERGVDRIELIPDGEDGVHMATAVIDRHVRGRLRTLIERPTPAEATVVGLLLEVDFKDGTAEVHEADGNVVRLSFSHDQDERLRFGAKSRVRAIGAAHRDHRGRIVSLALRVLEILDDDLSSPPSRNVGDDPFTFAQPLHDVSVLIGGLPDDRSAEEILDDLRASRRPRPEEY